MDGSEERKKRKASSSEATPSFGPVASNRSTPMKQAVRGRRGASNPEFRRAMRDKHNSQYGILNRQIAEFIESREIPRRYEGKAPQHGLIGDTWEYIRISQDIDRLYGGPKGDVVVFGNDDSNQLGLYEKEEGKKTVYYPTFLSGLKNKEVRMVSAGGIHSAAVTASGEVYTWGSSDDGCLGRDAGGDDEMFPAQVTGFRTVSGVDEDRKICQVSTGDNHCLFLSLEGNVYMCGMYKDTDSGHFCVPDGPYGSPIGSNAKPVHVAQIPQKAIGIYSGQSQSVALLEDHSIVTWGIGCCGEMARSADMTTPDENGNYDVGKQFLYCERDAEGRMKPSMSILREKYLKPAPPRWNFGSQKKNVVSVACGGFHLLVAARDPGQYEARVYSSGLNNYGQLGHGDEENRHELTLIQDLRNETVFRVAAGEHHSHALRYDGTRLYSFGRADYGQLGTGFKDFGTCETKPVAVIFPSEERKIITDIVSGDRHTLAMTLDKQVYSWGFGETGATGHKTLDDKHVYTPTLLDLDKKLDMKVQAHQMSGGGHHTLLHLTRHS